MVVVYESESGGGYVEVAEKIASERGERVVTDLDTVERGRTVIYVSPPSELREETILRLQKRLLREGYESGDHGIITGVTPEAAWELYAGSSDEDGEHGLILRKEDGEIFVEDEDATVLTREESTVDNLAVLQQEGMDSLSLMINSQSLHAFLTDGYICGFPDSPETADFEEPSPPCVVDGERDCPLDGDLISAESLTATHVFLNSCMSIVSSNSYTGLPVHVGTRMLKGVDSLIGGYGPMDGIPEEVALHYDLLRSGYDAAERCYILNKNAHGLELKSNPYAVFGRPDRKLAQASLGEYDYELRREGDSTALELRNVNSHVVDVRFSAPYEEIYLLNQTEKYEDAPLYYTAFEEDGEWRLLIYSWGKMRVEQLSFEITDSLGNREESITAAYQNASALDRIGMLDSKCRGQIKNLKNKLSTLPAIRDETRYDTNAYRDYEQRIENCESDVENITDRIILLLSQRGPGFLSEEYRGSTTQSKVASWEEGCPNCERPVSVKRFEDFLGETRRLRAICPKCINVFDVPETDEAVWPVVGGDMEYVGETTGTVKVEFENPTDRPMNAVFFPWVNSDDEEYRGADVFERETVETELEPSEEYVATFDVDVSPLEDNGYSLYGYVIANGNVYLGINVMSVSNS